MSLAKQPEFGEKQFYVCQVFTVKTVSGRSSIQLLEAFHLSDINSAIRKAERMSEAEHICGAIAYSIIVDEEAGEYGDMEDIHEFGAVPNVNLE